MAARAAMRIKQGDMVVVITGDDAGEVPKKVVEVVPGGRLIIVEGVNRVYKHVKRGHPKSPQGGRLSLERPIDSSNVQFYCAACHKGTRLGVRYSADGRKERFCKKCQTAAGTISPPRAKYAKPA
jgi:large subunit ribosomal protein L24